MSLTTYNCTALTGGAARALDSYSVDNLVDGDRALCAVSGELLYFMFDADGVNAEDVAAHPYKVRPDDYVDQGVWIEQECVQNPVTASAALTDNTLIRGDGGAKGVQECSTIVVSDDGEMVNTGQPIFAIRLSTTVENVTGDNSETSLAALTFTEEVDQGGNVVNGTFTAPITGKYFLSGQIAVVGLDSGHTKCVLQIVTSNRIQKQYYNPYNMMHSSVFLSLGFSGIFAMDANDTAHLTIRIGDVNKTVDLYAAYTVFNGILL